MPDAGTVVVGVDGTAQSVHALRWAYTHAAAVGASLRVVLAYQPRTTWSDMLRSDLPAAAKGPPVTADRLVSAGWEASALEAEALRDSGRRNALRTLRNARYRALGARSGRPRVRLDPVQGEPADVLVKASERARLLVLGSHRESEVAAVVAGSVSIHCILHAACPVVVVPSRVAVPAPNGGPPARGRGKDAQPRGRNRPRTRVAYAS